MGDATIRCVSSGGRRSLQPFSKFEQCHELGDSRVVESVIHGVSSFGGRSACTCFFQQLIGSRRRPRTLSFIGRIVSVDVPHAQVSPTS